MDEACVAFESVIETMDEAHASMRALDPIERRTNMTSCRIHFIQG